MEYILFSAIGRTDPIKDNRDGGILHICRKYKPKKVYLYMSDEMLKNKADDDRYLYCLKQLQSFIDFSCEIVEIEIPNLTDVHVFDGFYVEFDKYIKEIAVENPDMTVLLNVSSGTPAMKSALEIISVTSDLKIKAVQVASPFEREERAKKESEYIPEYEWEENDDNKVEKFKDRCTEIKSDNLILKIKKEIIKSLADNYDYVGALEVGKSVKEGMESEVVDLLQLCVYRTQLNKSEVKKIQNKLPQYDLIPKKQVQKKVFLNICWNFN